jgi:hypothetical protein
MTSSPARFDLPPAEAGHAFGVDGRCRDGARSFAKWIAAKRNIPYSSRAAWFGRHSYYTFSNRVFARRMVWTRQTMNASASLSLSCAAVCGPSDGRDRLRPLERYREKGMQAMLAVVE